MLSGAAFSSRHDKQASAHDTKSHANGETRLFMAFTLWK
jgi:hypothetical protein